MSAQGALFTGTKEIEARKALLICNVLESCAVTSSKAFLKRDKCDGVSGASERSRESLDL